MIFIKNLVATAALAAGCLTASASVITRVELHTGSDPFGPAVSSVPATDFPVILVQFTDPRQWDTWAVPPDGFLNNTYIGDYFVATLQHADSGALYQTLVGFARYAWTEGYGVPYENRYVLRESLMFASMDFANEPSLPFQWSEAYQPGEWVFTLAPYIAPEQKYKIYFMAAPAIGIPEPNSALLAAAGLAGMLGPRLPKIRSVKAKLKCRIASQIEMSH